MVAPAACAYFIYCGIIYNSRGKLSACTFYLFLILAKMNTKEKSLETLAVINIFFLLSYFYFGNMHILKAAVIFSLGCLLIPAFLRAVHTVWSGLFGFLGDINSRVLLAVIYFIFLVPISMLQKIVSRKKQENTRDNFVTRQYTFSRKDFETMG